MTVFARLIQEGVVVASDASLLAQLVNDGKSIVVTGLTKAGKAALLQALIGEVPDTHRLVIVEPSSQLSGPSHAMYLEAQRNETADVLTAIYKLLPDTVAASEIDMLSGVPKPLPGQQLLATAHTVNDEMRAKLLDTFDAVVHVERDPYNAPQISAIQLRTH